MNLLDHILANLPAEHGGDYVPVRAFAWAAADAWEALIDLGPDAGSYPTRVVATSGTDGLLAVHVSDDGGVSAYGVTVRLEDDVFIVDSSASGIHVDGRMKKTIPIELAEFTWSLPEPDGGRDGRTRDRTMLDDIFGILDDDGYWSPDTLEFIAEVFTSNGWKIRDPDESDE